MDFDLKQSNLPLMLIVILVSDKYPIIINPSSLNDHLSLPPMIKQVFEKLNVYIKNTRTARQ
jgi:hypothetical protein